MADHDTLLDNRSLQAFPITREYRHLLPFLTLGAPLTSAIRLYTRPRPIAILVEAATRSLIEQTVANIRTARQDLINALRAD